MTTASTELDTYRRYRAACRGPLSGIVRAAERDALLCRYLRSGWLRESDVNIDHIEALVGPLPQGREWERWCEYTQPLSLAERGKADAALAEAYEKIQELDDKLMEAEGAHENARRWFEEQKKQFARAKKAEAERDAAVRIFAAKVREAITGERDRLIYEERWTAADTRCLTFAVEALDALTPKEDS